MRLIAQDPVLLIGLIITGVFMLAFVIWPLARVIVQGFFIADGKPNAGAFNLDQFARYVNPTFVAQYWQIFIWTIEMGVLTAIGSTALGFLFAYTVVRCNIPFKRVVHAITLLPTISPPFAIALAAILLFGRSGLVTKDVLHIQFKPGVNDIYGLDGLVFVQIITFFSVAYLIIRGMLERIDPSMEEAALSLGASKWHIFRTITLPLLTPGIAASFLLMFVEALADLGNPIFIGGNVTVLSTQIWIAVNGEFNQQKGAALSLILLLPTLTVYILQRYWVSRKSYISVTGKPTGGGTGFVKEPLIRWTFITLTFLVLVLVLALYAAIFLGSITRLWGIDYTLDFTHYGRMFAAGLTAILDTTFLSALATPIAGHRRHGDCVSGRAQDLYRQRGARLYVESWRRGAWDDPGDRLHHRLHSSADAGRHFDLRDARLLRDCARRAQFHRARRDSAGGDAAGHGRALAQSERERTPAAFGKRLAQAPGQVCRFWTCRRG